MNRIRERWYVQNVEKNDRMGPVEEVQFQDQFPSPAPHLTIEICQLNSMKEKKKFVQCTGARFTPSDVWDLWTKWEYQINNELKRKNFFENKGNYVTYIMSFGQSNSKNSLNLFWELSALIPLQVPSRSLINLLDDFGKIVSEIWDFNNVLSASDPR